MAAVVSSNSLGLLNSSLYVLGAQGALGQPTQGRSGEQVFVNGSSGNLVIQNRDELVIGRGPDLSLLRTYNSQGLFDGDNNDNWRFGVYRKVYNLTGTVNTAGSTVTRVAEDGSESVYTFDATLGKYVCHDGGGSFDTLSFTAATQTWTWSWSDGTNQLTELYDNANGGRITKVQDQDGNGLTFTYNAAGLITQVSDANGESTFLDYTGTNLTQLRTVNSGGQTLVRTRYAYDASNRLITVTTDLSPEDASVADGKTYVVSYTYDGTSKRVATLTQTDGNNLSFTYIQVGTAFKIASYTDATGKTTSLTYTTVGTDLRADITDPLGLVTSMVTNAQGRLTQILSAAVGGVRQSVSYAYDANGNVTSVTDARGLVTTYGYDAGDNRVLERDAAGNTITRVYSAGNLLLAETGYVVPDPDGAGAGQPGTPLTVRYAYDSLGHLRFSVSAEGRVTEYRYNAFGQRLAAIQYTGSLYNLTGLTPTSTLTEAQLNSFVAAADKTKTERVDSSYDFRGHLASATSYANVDASGNGVADGTQSLTQYVYDQAGNLLKTIDPRGTSTADPNDFVATYVYDGMGRVTASTDATGRVTLTQYDDANKKTVLTGANGLVTTSIYDARDELISVVQSANSVTLGTTGYFYDADGRLRRAVDPTGISSHVLYDEAGRKVATIDGTGSLTEYRYDADNNLTRTIQYATAVTAAALASLSDAQGNPTAVALAAIRPAGSGQDRSTWNAYDSANHLVKSVDPLGFVTQNFYDGAGRLTDAIKFATAISTAALTDTPAPTSINPASNALDRLTRNFYDGDGKLRGTLDGEGYLVEYKYDAAGQLVETVGYATVTTASLRTTGTLSQLIPTTTSPDDIHSYTLYNAEGQVVGSVDGEGYLTETVYDAAGNKTQVIRYATKATYTAGAALSSLRPASNAKDQVSAYTYTALNQIASATNFEGTVTAYTYDEVGHLTQSLEAVNTAEVRGLTTQYDKQGRVTAQLSGVGSALLTGNLTQAQIDAVWAAHATHYAYDAAGRRTSATDADGWKTLYYYDADGQLNTTINALGEVTQAVYNALGQQTKTVQYGTRIAPATLATLTTLGGGLANSTLTGAVAAIANAGLDSATSYAYTTRGQVASTTDPMLFATTQTYDAFGDVVASSQQIATGQTLDHTYAFDRRGLLTQTVWDPGFINTTESTQYDAFGRKTQTTDARGNVRTQAYDRLGRVVTATVDPGAGHLGLAPSASYDAFSRVLTQTDALGKTTTYAYDAANRSITVTTPENIVTTTMKNRHGDIVSVTDGRGNTTTYQYDKDGHLITVDAPGTDPAYKTYDDAGLLTATIDADGTSTIYAYDTAGRVLTRTVDPGHLNLVTTYAYDAKGQTVSVTDAKLVVTQTQFDLKGQVTSVTVDPGAGHLNLTTTFTYDGRGKKLTVTEGSGSANPRLTRYTYDKLGRLITQQVDPNAVNATTTYVYDKNDNVAKRTDANGNVTRYAYDAADRLVYTVDALGGVTKNEYDADGRVVRTTAYATPLSATALAGLLDVPAVSSINPQAGADEITGHVYDKDGREIFTIDALGAVTQKVYDASGNVGRTVAFANALQGTFTPGVAPQIVASAPASGAYVIADASRDRVERTVYDAVNRAVYSIDAMNFVTETQYDDVGQILKTIQYTQQVSVSALPTVAEMAIAVSDRSPVTASNQTDTLNANPVQPYAYSTATQQDTATAATQTVAVTNSSVTNSLPPSQPYTYVASANSDTAGAATQAVSVTSASQTNSTAPSQPYAYVASAKSDVTSAASQAGTLTVQNTSQLQSGIVKNYAWYRSGGTLVTGAGISLDVGAAARVDNTPTQVRADLYLNGVYYTTVYTDVGSAAYEQWILSGPSYDESGNLVNPGGWGQVYVGYEYGYQGYHFYGVNNWNGQVNLSTNSLPAGNYTVNIFTRDDYAPTPDYGTGYYDFADGTWATSNSVNITVGTVVQPTLVSWATSLQPAGTTVSFKYRVAGSTGAFTSVSVGVSGANHQANLGSIAAGNYEYQIQYTDGYGRVLKSAGGTLTTTAGQTTSTTGTFNFTQVTSTATAGSSINGYIPLAQVPTIDRVSATVTDAATGAVVSSGVLTYPEFEASYSGQVNLKLGSQLGNGRYNVAITIFYKDGHSTAQPVFVYEMGPQNVYFVQTLSWAASTALAGTTPTFLYRTAGSTGAYTSAPVTLSGTNHQVTVDHVAGNYEYQIQYKDSYNRILKSAAGTFTVTGSGSTSVSTTFNYTQITSTASAGSSISGYIPLAQVSTIDRVSATVTDVATGAVASSGVLTYPEFEASYNGQVNLKVGSQLANGRYNVAITIFYKDGHSTAQPVFIYEVGPQAPWILDTLSWAASTALSGTTPTFLYRTAGSTGAYTSAPVTLSGTNHQVALDHFAAGNYEYQIQYKDSFNRVLKSTSGTFTAAASGSSTVNNTFNYTQITSTASTGSSITGYITAAEVPNIDYVDATVRDLAGNVVSTARTYPEFEPGSNGRVNLKLGAPLADAGKYNITIVVHMKDGSVQTRPVVYYEVGLQPYQQRTTTIGWATPAGVAGTTAQFTYSASGSSSFTSAAVTANGANQQVALINLADGSYGYFVRYYNGTQLVKEASGTFTAAASGSGGTQLQFQATVDDHRQINSFHYDAAGRMDSSTDAEGFTETYGYDQVGNKTSFTNKKGATWNYVYDAAGRMTSEITPQVAITSVNASSLLPSTSNAAIETRTEYDALGNVTARVEAYGRVGEQRRTEYRYDALGRQTKTIYPSVNIYDTIAGDPHADNLSTNGIDGTVTATEINITPETNVTFDALGNAVMNRDAAGNYSYKAYDVLGRVKYEIDAERFVTLYGYDAFGNRTSVTRYDARLNFAAIPGFVAHTDGTAFSVAEVASRVSVGPNDRTITTVYDALNRAGTVIEPAVFTFDSSAPAGSPQYFSTVGRTTKYVYNAYGQVLKQSVLKNPGADLAVGTADDTWEDTYFYYDARGYKSAQIDALGYLTTWQYDETGDILQQTEYAQARAAGTWSTAGFGTAPQPNSAAGDRVTAYQYDRKNQKVAETRVNADFATITGTVTLVPGVGNLTTSYGYDGVGNLTSTIDPTGATTYNYYDALGHVVASAQPARASAAGGNGTVVIPPVTVTYSTADGSPTLSFARNASADTVVVFEYVLAGASNWTAAPLTAQGSNLTAHLTGLASGHWQYRIKYTSSDGTIYATGTGDLNYVGGSSAASTTLAAAVQPPMSFGLAQSAGNVPYLVPNGEGGYYTQTYWNSTNTINASWNSLAALGGGDIRVRVTYLTYAMEVVGQTESGYIYQVTNNGAQAVRDFTFSDAQADTGAQLVWYEDQPGGGYFGVQQIYSIQVFKTVDGQAIDVTNATGSDRLLIRGKTAGLTGVGVTGTTSGNPINTTLGATALGDGIYAVNLASLARGTYSFIPQGVASVGGSFEVVHSNPAAAAQRTGVQETNPAGVTRTLNVFGLPSTAHVVLQYRLAGSTGPYLSKTLNSPAGAGGDFTIGYDDVANGNYDYILTATNSSGAPLDLTALGGTSAGTLAGTLRIGRGGVPPVMTQSAAGAGATAVPVTTMSYDVFGNVVQTTRYAKGLQSFDPTRVPVPVADPANDQTTSNFYDTHGNLTRTADPMQYSRFSSYDVLGHVAKTWQPITDNDGLVNNAVQVFTYDKLGHQIATIEPSYHPNGTLANNPIAQNPVQESVTYALVQSGGWTESGWTPNVVAINWAQMASWGGGDILVHVAYTTPPVPVGGNAESGYIYGPPVPAAQDFVIGAGAATGYSVSWTGDTIYGLSSVQVYKKDISGNPILLQNRGYLLSPVPQQPGTTVVFKYKLTTGSTWSTAPLYNMGAQYLIDLGALANATYNYEIEYTRPGETNPSSASRGVFNIVGASISVAGGGTATPWTLPALSVAAFQTSQVLYNAFGEIIDKGLNGGWQEHFEYDNAGHLWRTSQNGTAFADNKVYLYDLQGKGTAQIESQTLDLKNGFAGGVSQIAQQTSGVQRTNTLYDKLERATAQMQPSFVVGDPVSMALETVSVSVTDIAQYVSTESGAYWSGANTISLGWSDLGSLGAGKVEIVVNYTTPPQIIGGSAEYGYVYSGPVPGSRTFVVDAVAGATGTTVSWSGETMYSFTSVQVRKYDLAGSASVLVHNTGGSTNSGRLITWLAPASASTTVQFNYKLTTESGWHTLFPTNLGSYMVADLRSLPAGGTYNFLVIETQVGKPAYTRASGTFNSGVNGSIAPDATPAGGQIETITPTTTQLLDRWGNTVSSTDARGFVTTYKYNYLNQVTEVDQPLVDIIGTDGIDRPAAPVTKTYYDKLGRVLVTIDPNGNRTTERYDAAGQRVTEYHADNGFVSFQYDMFGRQIVSVDGAGKATTTVYNKNNQVVTVIHPIGTETYAYDQAGNRIRSTDANSNTTLYWYDTRGKLIRTRLPGGQETNDYYDGRGNQIKEVNANGDQSTWSYDYFGKLLTHVDLGAGSYQYFYDRAGHVTQQNLSRPGYNPSVTSYAYYESGAVKRITDTGAAGVGETYYEYDAGGNRVREEYLKNSVLMVNNRIAYDALGRTTSIADTRYTVTYSYDANGNRREAKSTYFDNARNASTVDYWYLYDGMNQVTLSQGTLSGTTIVRGSQGVALQYDGAGRRKVATTNAGDESYVYDDNGRLVSTNIAGNMTSQRTYDAGGRVTDEVSFSSPNVVSETRHNVYNSNDLITQQVIKNASGAVTQTTNYTAYDGLGNVLSYQLVSTPGAPYSSFTNNYSEIYAKFESYKESTINGTSSLFQPGSSTTSYDINGNVRAFSDQFNANKSRSFVTDGSGQILQRIDSGPGTAAFGTTQYYFYAGGKPVGTIGSLAPADFDFNYTPVSQQYPSESPSTHLVSRGDTLRSIALAVYGDSQLWYLIADANGLHGDGDLTVGQQLKIPNTISNIHNDYQTFKPVNVGEIIGDTTPTLPDPPPPPAPHGKGCGGLAMVLIIVVAVVATIFTAGAAAIAMSAALEFSMAAAMEVGMSVLAGTAAASFGVGAGVALGAAAIGGAVGSIASQGVGMAMGVQDKFSWSQVGLAAIGSTVTAGMGSLGSAGVAGQMGASGGAALAVNAAASNIITQGIAVATGYQDKFNWRSVAVAAIAAPLTSEIGDSISSTTEIDSGMGMSYKAPSDYAKWAGTFGTKLTVGLVNGAATQLVKSMVYGGGKVNFAQVAADSFGNVIGQSIAQGMASAGASQTKVLNATTSSLPVPASDSTQNTALAEGGDVFQPSMRSPYAESDKVAFLGGSKFSLGLGNIGFSGFDPVTDLPTPEGFDTKRTHAFAQQYPSTVYVPQIGDLSETEQGFLRGLLVENEERQGTINGSIGRNRFESAYSGVGPMNIDVTSMRINNLGNLSLEDMVKGMTSQGPDKYLGYAPYSGYSSFTPKTMGNIQGFDIDIGNHYTNFGGVQLMNGTDNGSVVVSAQGNHPDTGLPYFKLSVVDTTNSPDGTTGSHVVSGARYIWFEADGDGGYVMHNLGVSRALFPATLVGEQMAYLGGSYDRDSGGAQNANWRTFAEGVAQRIEAAGGSVAKTFQMQTYQMGMNGPNSVPGAPTRTGSFRFPSKYPN